MKALYYPEVNEVTVGDIADPVATDREVILRVCASGLCHTDIDVMRSSYGPSAFPVVPGHEYAGEVVSVGDGVLDFRVGDRVVVDPNLECGACPSCKKGWANLCENLCAYGVTEDGGFAEFCKVRAERLHYIGDLPYGLAALAEPMGCVLNGLTPLADRLLENAVIFGCGPMGLLMGLALKVRGVGEINMVDLDAEKLKLAKSMGLSGILAGSVELDSRKNQFDLAIDATGVIPVAERLVDFVSYGGVVSFFGACPRDAKIKISPFEVFRRQLTLLGTHSLNHNIPEALDVIQKVGPDLELLITHRLNFEQLADVVRGKKLPGSLKVQVQMDHNYKPS